MAKIGYTVGTSDGLGSDLGDLLVQRDIFSEGNLFAWGYNGVGNLGDSTLTNRSSPVQTIAGGNNWKQVDMWGSLGLCTAAIQENGDDF